MKTLTAEPATIAREKMASRYLYTEGMKIDKCESCHNRAVSATEMPNKLETFK